ncbi:MAG: hypothetical protein EBX94_05640 [Burkholderiaceae bacterium]|nr:hypothetical protein [Burkholderiaceae bacterium]
MIRITELRLPIDHAPQALEAAILNQLGIASKDLVRFEVFKRSYDARKNSTLTFIYTLDVSVRDEASVLKKHMHDPHVRPSPDTSYHFVAMSGDHRLAKSDLRPVVIGFGPCGIFAALLLAQMGLKPIVLERGKAVRERTQDTWALWRKKILNPESNVQFGEGGAGTFSDGKLAKPFSVGFRIEHPQSLIDRARLGPHAGHPLIGAADYKLVHHAKNGRSVYSFCMCPGGTVVAATSEPNRVVTNGMSQYSRNERNANAGIVVGIDPSDFPGGPLAGIAFQRELESRAFILGGSNYQAPGQLVGDFLQGKPSTEFGGVVPSYKPGVHLTDLATSLPGYAIEAIREAIPAFEKKIKGFAMPDAVLTGVETRTSSPLQIKRGPDYQSINTKGLYPAGEGAGYAGGIMSAGIDGIKVAEAIALDLMSA